MPSMDDFPMSTAPVVGRHKKSKSLAAFDPLALKVTEPLKGLSLGRDGKSTPVEGEDSAPITVSEKELYNQLRAIASELGKQSSTSPNQVANEVVNEGEEEDEKPEPNLAQTPVPKHRRLGSRMGSGRITAPSPAASPGGMPGIRWLAPGRSSAKKETRHNRSRSMPMINMSLSLGSAKKTPVKKSTPAKKTTPAHSRNSSRASLSSDMMQELWDLQEQAGLTVPFAHSGGELSIPSLAKPRPTSFLTGKEVVLSSEADATEWQLEIPEKTEFIYTCRASSFLDTYRTEKEGALYLDNLVGCSSVDLAMFVGGKPTPTTNKLGETHTPLVESLLECGTDLVQVQGYIRSSPVSVDPSSFREVFILERQRQFLCVLRGTTSEQSGKIEKQPETVNLIDNKNVSVFADRYKAFQELEPQLFGTLDQLMEENPFCDFVFAGHGFGGAMATLAAYRYSWARPELRVAALVTGNVKVGLPDFRLSANSLPNLKVVRVELGQPRPATVGVHVGHTVHINPGKLEAPIKAFKFSDDCTTDPSKMRKLRFGGVKDKTISDYVNALDDLGETWAKDFYREDGAGVKGKDNETRNVV